MTTQGSDWSLVTVTYNSRDRLLECWSRADIGAAHWIVVDNASTDDSVAVAKDLGATVIQKSENDGFSKANNVGLRETATEWVAFVNPDVIVPSARDLDRLAATSRANDALVAPQLLNPDGSEQLNARGLPYPGCKLANRGIGLPGVRLEDYARGGLVSPTYIAWAMGAAFAGPAGLFRDLGGWDERYFIYYEDHDIGLRSWRAGHTVVLEPRVRWVHQWQRATTRFHWEPWKHEMASMRTFYRTYPWLTWRRLPVRHRFRDLPERLWQSAPQ